MKISPAIRQGSALVGIAGALLLSGCSADASSAATPGTAGVSASPQSTAEAATPSSSAGASSSIAYKDGRYTADGSYQTPETVEKITVSVTIADDTVTAVKVTGDPQSTETTHYQGQFIGGISTVVVGKKLDDISVHKVAGSSLTSTGFNQALAKIRAEAKG